LSGDEGSPVRRGVRLRRFYGLRFGRAGKKVAPAGAKKTMGKLGVVVGGAPVAGDGVVDDPYGGDDDEGGDMKRDDSDEDDGEEAEAGEGGDGESSEDEDDEDEDDETEGTEGASVGNLSPKKKSPKGGPRTPTGVKLKRLGLSGAGNMLRFGAKAVAAAKGAAERARVAVDHMETRLNARGGDGGSDSESSSSSGDDSAPRSARERSPGEKREGGDRGGKGGNNVSPGAAALFDDAAAPSAPFSKGQAVQYQSGGRWEAATVVQVHLCFTIFGTPAGCSSIFDSLGI